MEIIQENNQVKLQNLGFPELFQFISLDLSTAFDLALSYLMEMVKKEKQMLSRADARSLPCRSSSSWERKQIPQYCALMLSLCDFLISTQHSTRTPIYKICCSFCCCPCKHWTWVAEEILAYGKKLRSTHCKELPLFKIMQY